MISTYDRNVLMKRSFLELKKKMKSKDALEEIANKIWVVKDIPVLLSEGRVRRIIYTETKGICG